MVEKLGHMSTSPFRKGFTSVCASKGSYRICHASKLAFNGSQTSVEQRCVTATIRVPGPRPLPCGNTLLHRFQPVPRYYTHGVHINEIPHEVACLLKFQWFLTPHNSILEMCKQNTSLILVSSSTFAFYLSIWVGNFNTNLCIAHRQFLL